MTKLKYPNIKYKDSYISAVKEFEKEGYNISTEHYGSVPLEQLKSNFKILVTKLQNHSKGIDLPKNYVPYTDLWIIDENDEYVGRISIRHYLNDHLRKGGGHIGYDVRPSARRKGHASNALKLALPIAKKHGIKKVLITCYTTNIPSKKVIEKNGGIKKERQPDKDKDKFFYEIDLSKVN